MAIKSLSYMHYKRCVGLCKTSLEASAKCAYQVAHFRELGSISANLIAKHGLFGALAKRMTKQ